MASVGLYLRLSDEDRDKKNKMDESESIQNQKSMLQKYCAERNWDIFDIYCDEDLSGADKKRPEFNRMLKDCENGKIDIVLCKSQSRFSREMEMIEKYIHDKFVEWGVRFIGVVDHADTSISSNKKARQINGLINEWYLEDVSENIRATLKHKREKGEFTGSFAPYGYLVDPENKNHLIIDEKTAPIVRQIFEWYNQGLGYRKIAIQLNELKLPNPTLYKKHCSSKYVNANESRSISHGCWTNTTIYRMIRNETYIGTLVQGKSHNISYKNKKRKKVNQEEWIRVPYCHEAIIDEETWERTQERLQSRVRTSRITSELTPLGGKVKCGLCGAPMRRQVYYNADKSKPKYNLKCGTYTNGSMNCNNHSAINGDILERYIIDEINRLISKYCKMGEIDISNYRKGSLDAELTVLENYQGRKHAIETRIENLYEDKLDGLLTKEQYISFKSKYDNELTELEEMCRCIEEKIKRIEESNKEIFDKQKILKKYSKIDKLTREIAEEFIDVIYIGEKIEGKEREITVNWNF